MRGDFHTHSTLDDGKSSLEEMAAAARAAGLTHFGFSGHSYCPLEEDYCIHREKIPEYLARARALQVQYAGEMEVFVGLELDLLGERPEGLDYAIGSVHISPWTRARRLRGSAWRSSSAGIGTAIPTHTTTRWPSCRSGRDATGSGTLTW